MAPVTHAPPRLDAALSVGGEVAVRQADGGTRAPRDGGTEGAGKVARRIPDPTSTMPAMRGPSTGSPSVSAEISTPRLGVASSAIAIVLARMWRPNSTTAQYAKAVAIGPT